MKIFLKEDSAALETEVHIICKEKDEEIETLMDQIQSTTSWLIGKDKDDTMKKIPLSHILYF